MDQPAGQGAGAQTPHDVPDILGLVARDELVVFPLMMAQLQVRDEPTIRLIDTALASHRIVGFVGTAVPSGDPADAIDADAASRETEPTDEAPDDDTEEIAVTTPDDASGISLPRIGTATVIHKMLKTPDGAVNVLIQGVARVEFSELTQDRPYPMARARRLDSALDGSPETEALARNVGEQFERMIDMEAQLPDEWKAVIRTMVHNPDHLSDFVAANLDVSLEEKRRLLEMLSVRDRLDKLSTLLSNELHVMELHDKIQSQVQGEMDRSQREFVLRKQLDAIRQELGEQDEHDAEIGDLRAKLEEANLPQQAKEAAERELDRLARMSPAAAEYTVSRTYVDWILALPWDESTDDNLDIGGARRVLDADHYALARIKDRILEYLSVRKLKADMKGPILCFSGPPGVGKTSLGRSIARALGRKFARMSLGGIRDEAEIRGHRRTYVGALPGRIVQALRTAGTNNPVIVLDEVDKIGQDFRGDPSSALLEVLDPEQNSTFSDHYLEIEMDLSKVMFITTANQLGSIPAALRDRMEVLELPGYTEEEKLQIARRHLLPRQLDAHGLADGQLRVTRTALQRIVGAYTREAGVRNLERELASICRKTARRIVEGKDGPVTVGARGLPKYLGPIRFESEAAEQLMEAGVVTGMAATTVGGEIIFVEATKMPGDGQLILTGQLGEVMRESARAALSYLKSQHDRFGIPAGAFKCDMHIHVPAGSTPKEGPSAGVTLLTALVSLFTNRRARGDVAMTGEINLRGKVMPIGGVKDKSLAAQRAGIKTIILPARNKRDLEDIPESIRKKIRFVFAEHIDDVLEMALEPAKKSKPRAAASKDDK